MAQALTLYTAKFCPFSHRVELALDETALSLPVTKYHLTLTAKPSWYSNSVNAEGKVPALALSAASSSEPAPPPEGSTILTESTLLCEFISDLGSSSDDPLTKYKARAFVESTAPVLAQGFMGFLRMNKPADGIYAGIRKLQESILANGGDWAVGKQFTLADISVAPFIARMEVTLGNDIGTYEKGEGRKVWERLSGSDEFGVFQKYWGRVKERESFRKTWDEEVVKREFEEKYPRKEEA